MLNQEAGCLVGARMVVHQNGLGEWEEHTGTRARSDCGDKYIHTKMRSCLQRFQTWAHGPRQSGSIT